MFNLDDITNESNGDHNKNWPDIPDRPYRLLITEGSRSGKTNALLNLIKEHNNVIILLTRFIYMLKI